MPCPAGPTSTPCPLYCSILTPDFPTDGAPPRLEYGERPPKQNALRFRFSTSSRHPPHTSFDASDEGIGAPVKRLFRAHLHCYTPPQHGERVAWSQPTRAPATAQPQQAVTSETGNGLSINVVDRGGGFPLTPSLRPLLPHIIEGSETKGITSGPVPSHLPPLLLLLQIPLFFATPPDQPTDMTSSQVHQGLLSPAQHRKTAVGCGLELERNKPLAIDGRVPRSG